MSNEINVEALIAERDALASDVHSARLFLREKDGLLRELAEAKNERDALAAKLAELEGQGPVGEIIHSAAGPSQDGAYRHVLLSRARLENQPLFARPIPPEQPVNARLLAAARAVVARWETPLWKDAPATAGFIYELRDAIAAYAESAPKAVRLKP